MTEKVKDIIIILVIGIFVGGLIGIGAGKMYSHLEKTNNEAMLNKVLNNMSNDYGWDYQTKK